MTGPTPQNAASSNDAPNETPTANAVPATAPAVPRSASINGIVTSWLRKSYLGRPYSYNGGTLLLNVQEFLHILETAASGNGNSWLSDDQLFLPMVLQLQNKTPRSDMILISPQAASALASIGLGDSDSEIFTAQAPGYFAAMTESNVRWVVIPCNDGMIQITEATDNYNKAKELAAKKAAEKAQEKEKAKGKEERTSRPKPKPKPKSKPKPKPKQTQRTKGAPSRHARATRSATAALRTQEEEAQEQGDAVSELNRPTEEIVAPAAPAVANLGMHWGMIIIDKETEDARFFDGDLERVHKTGTNKTINRSKWRTAVAAGKVLRGYDEVMGRASGQFQTGTLRHVPHDHLDNTYKGDKGSSCGPWVFAMLRYILQNPTFLTEEGGLKGAFARGRKRRHVMDLGFDSSRVRHDMQDLIAEARKTSAPTKPPHQLDTVTLQSLNAITPDALLFHLNSQNEGSSGGRRSGFLRGNCRNGPGDPDDDDDDDDDWPDEYRNVSIDDLRNEIPDDRGLTKLQRLEEAYQLFMGRQLSLQSLAAAHGRQFGEDGAASNANVLCDPGVQESAAFQAIAKQAIDFVPMEEQQVNQWFDQTASVGFVAADTSSWFKKAFLQRAFGGFSEETLSKESAGEYRRHFGMSANFGLGQIIDALNQYTDKTPDLLGRIQWYPDYYLREHGVAAAANNAPNGNIEGNKDSNKNSNKDSENPKKRKRGDKSSNKGNKSKKTCRGDDLPDHPESDVSSVSDDEQYHDAYTHSYLNGSTSCRNDNVENDSTSKALTDNASKENDSSKTTSRDEPAATMQSASHSIIDSIEIEPIAVNSSIPPTEPVESAGGDSGNSDNSPEASNPSAGRELSAGGGGGGGGGGGEEPDNNEAPTGNGRDEHDSNEGRDNNSNADRDNDDNAASDDSSSSSDDEPPRSGDGILDEPHAMPAGLIEFRTMPFEQLQTYMTEEKRADPRLHDLDPNIASWRAFLYVTVQLRHFGDASDYDCVTHWLQDSIVFTDEERGLDWIAMGMTNIIRERMNLHYGAAAPTEIDPGNMVNFSDTEPESGNNSPVPSENSSSQYGSTIFDEAQRQQAQARAQRDLATLDGAARALSQTVDDHLHSINFTIERILDPPGASSLQAASGVPDDGGDGGNGSSSDSSLSWPDDTPSNSDSSGDDSDSSSEGGSGCGTALGKHPRGSDDDDSEGQGGSTKKPRLGGNQSPPRSPAGSSGGDQNPDNRKAPSGQSSAPNPNDSFSSQATVEDETIEIYIDRQPYILDPSDTSIFLPFDTTRATWPAGVTELPNFADLTSPELKRWRIANPDMEFPTSLGIHQYTTALAMLQMRFKCTFMHEPDKNFTETWINDGNVFTDEHHAELLNITNDLFRNGAIRHYMMATYEPEMLRRVAAMPKPKFVNPKITVQKGTFEKPESFKSDVHVGQKPVPSRRGSMDETRLSPNEVRVREGRTRYSMREKPVPKKKFGE